MSAPARAMAGGESAPRTGGAPARPQAIGPSRALRLQRECACGGSCDSCKKKPQQELLQRKANPGATAQAADTKRKPTAAPAVSPQMPAPAVKTAAPAIAKPAAKAGANAAKTEKTGAGVGAIAESKPPAKATGGAHAGKAGADKEDKAAAITEKKKPAEAPAVPEIVQRVLASPGQPLDPTTRFKMEGRFGRNFGDVRVHTDALAAESARAVSAHAYAVGQHIAFDSGQYRPTTPEGERLLAHELAHTIQQHGLQRSAGEISMETSGEYQHLEREAEHVSAAVMRQPGARTTPVSTRAAGGPTLSRAKSDSPNDCISCDQDESDRAWKNVPAKSKLAEADVKRYALPPSEAKSAAPATPAGTPKKAEKITVAVDMAVPFNLPAQKGNVISVWKQRMAGCNLEAIIDPGAGSVKTKAGLKEARPGTDELHKFWLQKVGWTSDYKPKWLQAVKATASGKADPKAVEKTSDFQPTKALGSRCQVDHILELQIGGNNVPENMQMLDGPDNEKSGRDIFSDLAAKAVKVRDAMTADLPDIQVQSVLMRFSQIKTNPPTLGPCAQAEAEAGKIGDDASGKKKDGAAEFPFDLMAGGFATKMYADTEDQETVVLAASPRNKAASTLIPGLSLTQWTRKKKGKGKGKGTDGGKVDAILDPKAGTGKGKTALPAALKGEGAIELNRDPDTGKLTLAGKRPNIKFHYNYLSDGTFNKFNVEDDGSISGAGTIKPSFSFLPTFDVAFDKEKFSLSKSIPKESLKLPIPGLTITDASVGLVLGPEFKPEGHVGFELQAGAKKLLDGDVTLSADADGLVADGKVHAFLPGVDNAEGNISLKNRQWSGSVKIETTQIQKKLKYVKSGSLEVVFSDAAPGMTAKGTVMLDLPGTQGVEATLEYAAKTQKWVFKGKGSFQIPRLKEAELLIEYDGEHLTGGTGPAGIAFEFHGIDGNLHLRYHDEKFSGHGKLAVKKGKTTGSIDVTMHEGKDAPTFSGKGEIKYQLTDNLVAGAGIEIDEHEKVRLTGSLEFPKPIPLFKQTEGDYKFFDIGVSIPIPGASIGPVGLKARIDGSLSAGYKLGPGELRDTKMEAAFNPLDEKPDVDVVLTSTLYIGASAYISGKIAGSIVVDAVVASVSGGLSITATAALDGHIGSKVTLHYQQSRIELDANFEMLVGLAITLALDAFVKGSLGVGYFSVEREKTWNLATYKYDTGMKFGMKLKNPIHYASDQAVKLPSFNDIEWTVPKIDPGDVLSKVFGSSASKEEKKG